MTEYSEEVSVGGKHLTPRLLRKVHKILDQLCRGSKVQFPVGTMSGAPAYPSEYSITDDAIDLNVSFAQTWSHIQSNLQLIISKANNVT